MSSFLSSVLFIDALYLSLVVRGVGGENANFQIQFFIHDGQRLNNSHASSFVNCICTYPPETDNSTAMNFKSFTWNNIFFSKGKIHFDIRISVNRGMRGAFGRFYFERELRATRKMFRKPHTIAQFLNFPTVSFPPDQKCPTYPNKRRGPFVADRVLNLNF
jgi:hypothetical protein